MAGERKKTGETVTREYTINLNKNLHKRHLYVVGKEERSGSEEREGREGKHGRSGGETGGYERGESGRAWVALPREWGVAGGFFW